VRGGGLVDPAAIITVEQAERQACEVLERVGVTVPGPAPRWCWDGRGPVTLDTIAEAEALAGLKFVEYAKAPVFCANPASWHPTLWVVQQHHHPALSWRRELLKADPDADTSWWTLAGWCGLCHDAYHTLQNMYVRAGEAPSWSVRRTFGVFVRSSVEEAWRRRPPVTPYT
jgi:hypothetical protein